MSPLEEGHGTVVKTVYEHYSVQLLSVTIKPSATGKKGHLFDLDICYWKGVINSVQADISTLKELHDALVDLSAAFGDLYKFPSFSSGGFSSLSKISDMQLEERTSELNKVFAHVFIVNHIVIGLMININSG